ncbi:hypothetical protein [Actinomadura violacea]|uniref:Uncharacterized protein n=1 Tax=Actinomadura violacea TaxID=2819934 RepID=A0ABS3RY55_9ACTN|nr:hypothetical protein [Actinomadura violacea]MBO2461699.1 hypothetical protein [Actinomadura violacea]
MICVACRERRHVQCTDVQRNRIQAESADGTAGAGRWCDCQHRPGTVLQKPTVTS